MVEEVLHAGHDEVVRERGRVRVGPGEFGARRIHAAQQLRDHDHVLKGEGAVDIDLVVGLELRRIHPRPETHDAQRVGPVNRVSGKPIHEHLAQGDVGVHLQPTLDARVVKGVHLGPRGVVLALVAAGDVFGGARARREFDEAGIPRVALRQHLGADVLKQLFVQANAGVREAVDRGLADARLVGRFDLGRRLRGGVGDEGDDERAGDGLAPSSDFAEQRGHWRFQ